VGAAFLSCAASSSRFGAQRTARPTVARVTSPLTEGEGEGEGEGFFRIQPSVLSKGPLTSILSPCPKGRGGSTLADGQISCRDAIKFSGSRSQKQL